MKLVSRWMRLRPTDRSLVVQAVLFLVIARMGLKLFPLKTVTRFSGWVGTLLPDPRGHEPADHERIAWAVGAVSRNMLGDRTCLAQALAGQELLQRRGYSAELRIGVAKGRDGKVVAHAWVESEDKVVLGGPAEALEQYTPLPGFEGMLS